MKTKSLYRLKSPMLKCSIIVIAIILSFYCTSHANDSCRYIGHYLYNNNFVEVKKEVYPNSGNIKITAPQNAQLSFVWDDGSTNSELVGLTKGSYKVAVSDAVGCVDSLTISVASINDMLAYYPLNKTANDASGNAYHGTNHGASDTTNMFEEDSAAFHFNPVEYDYIQLGSSLKPTAFPISVFIWVNLDSLRTTQQFIFRTDQWSSTGKYGGIKLNIDQNGYFSAAYGTGKGAGPNNRFSKKSIEPIDMLSKWVQLGAVYYDNQDIKIFLNGEEIEGTYAGNGNSLGYSTSAGAIGVGISNHYNFSGSMDEIRFYNQAFSSTEVGELYRYEKRELNLEAGLIRNYKLDGNLIDELSSFNNGDSINANATDRAGIDDQCFAFNQEHYLVLPTIGNWGTKLCMSLWFKPESLNNGSTRSTLINSRTSGNVGYANFQLEIDNTDLTTHWNIWGTNVNHVGLNSTNSVNVGEWNHILVISNLETNEMHIVLNGQKTTATGILIPRYKNAEIFLGGVYPDYSQSASNFIGKIDEFKVYNRILSDEEADLLKAQEFQVGESYKLMAHYPLNGNASDVSVNEKHGTVYGATSSDRFSITDQTFEMDGSNNVTVPSIGNWGNELSISMWFKADVLETAQTLFGNRAGSSGSTLLNIIGNIMPDSTVRLVIASDAQGEPSCFSTNNLVPNEWNHVIFEQNRTNNTISVILNGVESSVTYAQTPRYLDLGLGFGNLCNSYNSTVGLIGKIDEVRIYNRVLRTSEKNALLNQHFKTGINYKQLVYYPMNGNMGDSSGNGYDATINGALPTPDRNGNTQSAYAFNGSSQNIETPELPLNANELSVSFWCYTRGLRQHAVFMDKDRVAPNILGAHIHYLPTMSNLYWDFGNIQDGGRIHSYNTALQNETWEHYSFVTSAKGNFMKVYLNGNLILEGDTHSSLIDSTLVLLIGGGSNGTEQFYRGSIDDFRIHNRALTQAEVKELIQHNSVEDTVYHAEFELCEGDSALINGNYYSESGIYTDTLVAANGADSIIISQLTVYALPEINLSGDLVVCDGASTLLSVDGANTYWWSTAQTASFIYYKPSQADTLWVEATNAKGCKFVDTIDFVLNPRPSVTIAGDSIVCENSEIVLKASGANAFNWNNGEVSDSIIITAIADTSIAVVGTDLNGCTNTVVHNIVVNALPIVEISGESTICLGDTIELLASGAESFVWYNDSTSAAIQIAPIETANYTVSGTDTNGCSAEANHAVIVNSLPALQISGETEVCIGSSIELVVTGAQDYLWSTNDTNDSISVSPVENSNYSVTGTDENGCENTTEHEVLVNALPEVAINGDAEVCAGSAITLSASGAESYVWSNEETTSSITLNPLEDILVALIGTDANGCTNSDELEITVHRLPILQFAISEDTICQNASSITLEATPVGGIFMGNGVLEDVFNASEAGEGRHAITYEYTDSNGCEATASDSILVINCTSVLSTTEQSTLHVYPNPSKGIIRVSIANDSEFDVVIYQSNGAMVYKESNYIDGNSLDVSRLQPGVYLIKINHKELGVFFSRLVIE